MIVRAMAIGGLPQPDPEPQAASITVKVTPYYRDNDGVESRGDTMVLSAQPDGTNRLVPIEGPPFISPAPTLTGMANESIVTADLLLRVYAPDPFYFSGGFSVGRKR